MRRSCRWATARRDRALGGLGIVGPDPHGLPRQHGRGSRRGPLRRPPAGRELRLRLLDGNRLLRRAGRCPGARATDEIKRAYRRLARDLHPDVNPDPEAKERFQEVTRAYEALTDPEKRRIVDLGGDPFDTGGGGGGGFGTSGFGGLGDIMDAFFGGAATRGPRSRHPRRARRAHPDRARARRDRVRHHQGPHGRHRRPVQHLHGRRDGARHPRRHLQHLLGPRRGAERAARLPRPGRLQPHLPELRRHRPGHPRAVPRVRRRRPRPRPPHHHGEGAGRRRGRHADPADRPGRGRPRRRPRRRPVRRDPRAAARRLHPRRRGPALPGHAADDLRARSAPRSA